MTAKKGIVARSPAVAGSSEARDSAEDYRRMVDQMQPAGLLSAGGAFAHFPGAVLIAGPNGMVLGANDQAEAIAHVLQAGLHEELRAAIQAALAGTTAQVNPLVVAAAQTRLGEVPDAAARGTAERAYDVVVLPWADGTAALLLGRDVTLERSLRAALVESRQRYKDLVEISNDFAWETDAEGRFVFVSPRGALGYEASDLVGRPARDLLLDSETEGAAGADTSPFTARTVIEAAEMWVRSAQGAQLCLLSTALPLSSESGAWIGARGVCRDITGLRCHEAELAEARNRERLFSYIVNMVRRELEPARMLSATAEALLPALALTGISIHALVDGGKGTGRAPGERKLGEALAQAGKPAAPDDLGPLMARFAGDAQAMELEDVRGGLLLRATRYRDRINGLLCARREGAGPGTGAGWSAEDRGLFDNIAGQVGLAIEQLARQTEMEVLSMTDPLTGLDNRRGFEEKLERQLAKQQAGENVGTLRPGALIYIDLDNFKQVNDTHGHQTGDEALLDVAALLKEQIRAGDLAARLGGDEFALFLGGMDRAAAERKAEHLLKAAERLRGYSGDTEHLLGISLGIAIHDPRTGEGLESLLRRADEAMYGAKRAGKHGLNFAPDHDRRNRRDGGRG